MELYQLKEQIVKKALNPLYIFTGEEVAIMDIYIKQVAAVKNATPTRVDSISGIYRKLQTSSLMSKPKCYVIRDDKEYMTQENIWEGLNVGAIQGDNVIILVFTNLDKRSKFYKHHSEMMVEFAKLSNDLLAKYIKKEIGLDAKNGVKLAELCNSDYSRILLECDKLNHLALATKKTIEHAFEMAVENKLIYCPPKDVIFEFIDAVCKRQIKRSFDLLAELNAINESPLAMISLLYTNFRSMLLVQTAGGGDNLTSRTGLTPWQVKLAKEKGNHYSANELVAIIKLIRQTEKAFKTGGIEQDMAISHMLINIF